MAPDSAQNHGKQRLSSGALRGTEVLGGRQLQHDERTICPAAKIIERTATAVTEPQRQQLANNHVPVSEQQLELHLMQKGREQVSPVFAQVGGRLGFVVPAVTGPPWPCPTPGAKRQGVGHGLRVCGRSRPL